MYEIIRSRAPDHSQRRCAWTSSILTRRCHYPAEVIASPLVHHELVPASWYKAFCEPYAVSLGDATLSA
jgi:hypothetical protein